MGTIPLRLKCPSCGHVERMSVTAPLAMWSIPSAGVRKVETSTGAAALAAGATVCPNCSTPFGVNMRARPATAVTAMLNASSPEAVDNAFHGATVTTFPKSKSDIAKDENLPLKVRDALVFIQEDALQRRNPAGIMSGARGCLDVALKSLGETDGGRRTRIDNLLARGLVTASIAAWAQNLWEEGSDAVHDLDAEIERAVEHVEFLKLFFEVAFGLPARIAQVSHDSEAEVVESTSSDG